ncbi:MAG: cell division ATP-binding protein FtsE [Alphaproteobacteria bacterium]|nr:cell division ATP-binding protein FtsE [Alphaproteobacteria bacterium]
MIRFENVGLRYGSGPEVLHDVELSLESGSYHFLVGPSGAGKSSLLSLLYLARRPTRGLVTMFGQDIASAPRSVFPGLRRRIGVVFQDYHLLDHLTTFDNVALPLRVAGAAPGQIRDHVLQLLEWVGLGDKVDVQPPFMSGGEKQRVAVARAVIGQPDLLLADEPTGNLDEAMAERLMRLFEELNRQGTTLLIATHDTSLPRRFLHPVLRLDQGELGHEATP